MATAKKKSESRSGNGSGENKPARGGLAQQVTPDASLAAVIGSGKKTRAEITKAIWEYVREHNLQDTKDRRQINADDKLKQVFDGKDRVSMFEMTKLVNQHLQ
jgi:upstream activation factor subunit UAF30